MSDIQCNHSPISRTEIRNDVDSGYFNYCRDCKHIRVPPREPNGGSITLPDYWTTIEEYEKNLTPNYIWKTTTGIVIPKK